MESWNESPDSEKIEMQERAPTEESSPLRARHMKMWRTRSAREAAGPFGEAASCTSHAIAPC